MQDNAAPNAIPDRTPQRVRHELRMRLLEVRDVEALTPNMRRVTLGGDDLEGFESPGFDDHVKHFFPDPQTGELVLPKVGPEGVAKPAPGDAPRLMRDYTPRRFDAATRTLVSAPSGPRPVTCVTSRESRASMGMSRNPSPAAQSIVESGAATWNGTPASRAASALR